MQVDRHRFRQLREDAGLTQEELAARAGVVRATVQNIEAGRNVNPTRLTRRALADVLGVAVEEFDERPGSAVPA